jgi:hypothetical protein
MSQKHRDAGLKFETEVELDAYKFIGAYLGSTTCLQVSGANTVRNHDLERCNRKGYNRTLFRGRSGRDMRGT